MKYFLALGVLLLSTFTFAQNTNSVYKPSRDYVMLQFGWHTWTNVPDSIKLKNIGREFNAYLCYDFPIQKSNFSFAAGAGISSSNIYLDSNTVVLTDSMMTFPYQTISYTRYKLSHNYIEAPFELRYFSDKLNRNKGIKAAIGLKVGYAVNFHTKGLRGVYSKPFVEKESSRRFIQNYRAMATARIGYGNFSLYGSYQLTQLFYSTASKSGPQNLNPVSVGITISGL